METRSTFASRPWPRSSVMPRYGCSPTTDRFPARRSACGRDPSCWSTRPTKGTSTRPCTGTASVSTTGTQKPMSIGGSFSYRLEFPDPGVYWYHPHIREDYGQELGLYGNIVVVPADADYWPEVNREITLALDDILLEDGKVAPFSRSETNY